jgi:calcineurin-like phosphoesterase family protein
MSTTVYFISDLHLGHKRILDFSGEYRGGTGTDSHDEWLIDCWNSTVKKKRDIVYVLGDVAFSRDALYKCARLTGEKRLIAGNHDKYRVEAYSEYFRVMPGVMRYKEFWLSHAPLHPDELRGLRNVHGHVHHRSIDDERYLNVSVEAIGGCPVTLDKLRIT